MSRTSPYTLAFAILSSGFDRRDNARILYRVALWIPRLDVTMFHWLAVASRERMILNSHKEL